MSQITKMARKESGGTNWKMQHQMGRISQIAYFTTYWYIQKNYRMDFSYYTNSSHQNITEIKHYLYVSLHSLISFSDDYIRVRIRHRQGLYLLIDQQIFWLPRSTNNYRYSQLKFFNTEDDDFSKM